MVAKLDIRAATLSQVQVLSTKFRKDDSPLEFCIVDRLTQPSSTPSWQFQGGLGQVAHTAQTVVNQLGIGNRCSGSPTMTVDNIVNNFSDDTTTFLRRRFQR